VQLGRGKRLVTITQEDTKDIGHQGIIPADEVGLQGTLAAKALEQGICAHDLSGLWIDPIHSLGVAVIGKAGLAIGAQLAAHRYSNVFAAIFPPVIVDLELGI
jgi:hypothetical protein